MRFGHMHIFTYSPRQGTKAAGIAGPVDGDVKRKRSRELHELGAEMKANHLGAFLGTARPVLWEGNPDPLPSGDLLWSGYTDNYLRVSATAPPGVNLENQIEDVILAELAGERFSGTRANRP
jgi:threonylcarbamoyladenosine tRNA methylthiotransferase MtaB